MLDNITAQIPEEAQDHPFARMMVTMFKESRKDLKRIPPEVIEALSRTLGEAMLWIADGEWEESDGSESRELPGPEDAGAQD